jgi:ADP-ribose pyrophosphatase
MVEPENRGLWEFPAGLVEEAEQSAEGLRRAAVRELLEETGFAAPAEKLSGLGPSSFPSPGVIGERHFYFQVEVDPREQREPELDGSPLEAAGELIAVPLSVALAACRKGDLADAKSEIALRRLVEQLTLNGETT